MSRINFKDIKLAEPDLTPMVITYNEQEIEVKKFISIEDKYNLISITLQEAEEGGVYNEVKMLMYYSLNLVYKYANIQFEAEDRIDPSVTFDKLNQSGFMSAIIKAIPKEEQEMLYNALITQMERNMKDGNSIAEVIRDFIDKMTENAEKAKELFESFDKEKYKEVIEFARAANGGRPLPTSQR